VSATTLSTNPAGTTTSESTTQPAGETSGTTPSQLSTHTADTSGSDSARKRRSELYQRLHCLHELRQVTVRCQSVSVDLYHHPRSHKVIETAVSSTSDITAYQCSVTLLLKACVPTICVLLCSSVLCCSVMALLRSV